MKMSGIKHIVLLHFLMVNIISGSDVSESQPCGIPADVTFLIDSSRSITSVDYAKQIEFVKEMVNMFEIGPNATHIAALTFAEDTAVEFFFEEYETSEAAKQRIGNITHANGAATYTHNALKSMREDIFTVENGMRTNVPKIGILLTDGRSTSAYRTQKEAKLAKEAGINLIAVGIGNINSHELETLVSPPAEKNFLYRKNFDELKSEVTKKLVAQSACEALDISSKVSTQKTTQMSVTTTSVETVTTETSSTIETTSTLTTTRKQIPTTPKIVKIESTVSKTTSSPVSNHLSTESTTNSTTVSTTTTTGTTSTTEMKTTVTKPEPEVTTPSVTTTTLSSSSSTTTEMPNEEHGKKPQKDQPKCTPLVKADIIFGLQAIGGGDRENVANFIKAMGGGLDLRSRNFRLGIKENCKENLLYPTEFGYFEDYNYAVHDVMDTDITPILLHTRRAFHLSKRRADRVTILLISGKVHDMTRAYRLAERMKRNTKIIVVGVGNHFDTEQLQGLASYRDRSAPDISHVFPVTDSTQLSYIVKKVNKLLCN